MLGASKWPLVTDTSKTKVDGLPEVTLRAGSS